MSFCTYCGAALAADARFCPRCGKRVATAPPLEETIVETGNPPERPTPVLVPPTASAAVPPPPPATPPRTGTLPGQKTPRGVPPHPSRAGAAAPAARPQQSAGKWWIVPLVVVGLVVIAWLVLGGLPFGREEDARQGIDVAETETIADRTAPVNPPQTATIIEVPGDGVPTTDTAMPPLTTTAMSPIGVPPVTTTATTTPPATATTATIATPPPSRPSPAAPAARVTEAEAESRLRSYITSRNAYPDVARSCLQVRSDGYRNEGYGFSVWQACVSGGGAKRVGMWRVDAKDGSLYRRNDAGRYVSP